MICEDCGNVMLTVDVYKLKYESIRKKRCRKCGAIYYTSESIIDDKTGKKMFCEKHRKYREKKKRSSGRRVNGVKGEQK